MCNSFVTEVEMALALHFLSLLLSEAPLPVAVPGRRKRNNWHPTQLESLEHFVDVQEVELNVIHGEYIAYILVIIIQ